MKKPSLRMDALFDFLLSAFHPLVVTSRRALRNLKLSFCPLTCVPITFLCHERSFVLIC